MIGYHNIVEGLFKLKLMKNEIHLDAGIYNVRMKNATHQF